MEPVKGLAVTLISRDIVTPYSGSMPAYLSGRYDFDDMHIDLRPLAQFAGARVIQAEVKEIDFDLRSISLPGRPDLPFDILSLNTGSQPNAALIPGAHDHAIAVKPIEQFLEQWETLRGQAISRIKRDRKSFHLAIVGGGPASVELAFAIRQRMREALSGVEKESAAFRLSLISADTAPLSGHNRRVQRFVQAELQRRGIELILEHKVTEFRTHGLNFAHGESLDADAMIYATGASLPAWPADSGLKLAPDGFIEVNSRLQSVSHDHVFVAGDAATLRDHERPKSGVYAVRHGEILAENLLRYATGKSLKRYRPQRQALALMSLGDGRAIASRGKLFLKGRLVWLLKDWIDSRFVDKFSDLPVMPTELDLAEGLVDRQEERRLREHAMRCAGCGGKVASGVLEEVLELLPYSSQGSSPQFEDATLIPLEDDRLLLQSVDYLRSFVNDPWLFARIATNHCLSDIYAMGVMPHSALAIVGLPRANKKYTRAQLLELMLGCREALDKDECKLLGGHSAESENLTLGLAVNGFSEPGEILRKTGLRGGDRLILTSALGTGTLLAADMRHRARHDWMQAALQQMLVSNRKAAQIFQRHRAHACTDITGFGLAGHLAEMLGEFTAVEIYLDSVPVLPGAVECLAEGIVSSLHHDNSLVRRLISEKPKKHRLVPVDLLFDPQTAGGLLASVSEAEAPNCLAALQAAGYPEARIIGAVLSHSNPAPTIELL